MAEVIDDRTEGRNWPLPNKDNELKDDVDRLIIALQMADGDVTAILMALGQKAALVHGHTIDEITGLVSALDGKLGVGHTVAFADLSDVDVEAAANGQFVMRQADLWIPANVQIGHVAGLEAAINGKLSAAALTGAPAKATLVDADRLVIINSAGSVISTSLFSVLRTALKTINDALYATAAHVHAAATTAAAGFMSATDKAKLDGIAAGAGVVPGIVTTTINGLMAAADKVKLDGVAAGAQVNPTAAALKSSYEGNANTNAYTDAEKTKLAGVAAGATANATDAVNRARANHTGTQAVATITGLGTLATKNDASLTTDVIGILPVANGGTGSSSAGSGMAAASGKNAPVGFVGLFYLGTLTDNGDTISGSAVYVPSLSSSNVLSRNTLGLQTGTWQNTSGAQILANAGGWMTRIA